MLQFREYLLICIEDFIKARLSSKGCVHLPTGSQSGVIYAYNEDNDCEVVIEYNYTPGGMISFVVHNKVISWETPIEITCYAHERNFLSALHSRLQVIGDRIKEYREREEGLRS